MQAQVLRKKHVQTKRTSRKMNQQKSNNYGSKCLGHRLSLTLSVTEFAMKHTTATFFFTKPRCSWITFLFSRRTALDFGYEDAFFVGRITGLFRCVRIVLYFWIRKNPDITVPTAIVHWLSLFETFYWFWQLQNLSLHLIHKRNICLSCWQMLCYINLL